MNETRKREIVGKIEKELKNFKFDCLMPHCGKKAIQSHSQQRLGQLASIAENGFVRGKNRNLYKAFFQVSSELTTLTPITVASTSPIFCSTHDNSIFRELESQPFTHINERIAFLLSFRAMAFEVSQKRREIKRVELILESSLVSDNNGNASMQLTEWRSGAMMFLFYTGYPMLTEIADQYSRTKTELWIEWLSIGRNIATSCATVFSPFFEDYEKYFRWNSTCRQPLVMANIVPIPDNTFLIFAGDNNSIAELHLRKPLQFFDKKQLEIYLNWLAFVESEDTYISPSLWANASYGNKQKAWHAMRHPFFRGNHADTPQIISIDY